MGEVSPDARILDVLSVDLCARALLDLVPVEDLVRSERVCKRWQTAVLNYLRGCPTLGFSGSRRFGFDESYLPPVLKKYSRAIIIDYNQQSLPILCKTLEKWGHYIKKVSMVHGEDTYINIIVSKCPNIQQIAIVFCNKAKPIPSFSQILSFSRLKQIALIGFLRSSEDRPSDLVLAELFQNKNYDKISIYNNRDLTGRFLESIKPNNLKTLSLRECRSLTIAGLLSAVHNLRSLTNLELEEDSSSMLKDVGLLLKEMPQLKDLRLMYNYNEVPMSEESIEAFSGLVNLKRLSMRGSGRGVNDALLEVLAQACKELEYLEINEWKNNATARGVAALCRRSPSAVTTLDFSEFSDIPYDVLQNIFSDFIQNVPLYQELAEMGCLELTPEWFKAAARDPRGRRLALNPGPGGSAPRDGDLDKGLTLSIW